ncbi:MAG: NTP transferase domain-containing protein [Bdellovibrionales bacterium]|nr:NTP transferase domain-containing protein [Bdellovibrionales bacterium]
MRAMIMAAGLGTRLRPLTDATPKPLVPVAGRPMIAWVLDVFERAGFRDVLVNVHYLAEQLERFAGEETRRRSGRLRITIQDEKKEILGSGGAIALAAPWLFSGHRTAVVCNADSFMQPEVGALLATHEHLRGRSGVVCTLAVMEHQEAGRKYTGLRVADGLVREFVKADPGRAETLAHFPGLYAVDRDAVAYLAPAGTECNIVERMWRPAAAEGRLGAWNYTGLYQDLGTVADLAEAESMLQRMKGG